MSNDILPADIYTVINKTVLTDKDKDNLITLYTPIIGNLALSLYLTLWRDLNKLEIISIDLSHHHLIKILKSELTDIIKARETLEAVGLIKTYLKTEKINQYVYELYSPLSAVEFLNHPILNVVLYKNIGKKEYDLIKREYTALSFDLKGYKDITKKINKVFKSSDIDKVITSERTSLGIKDIDLIDFDLIINMLPKGLINIKTFNKSLKELINNLAFLYNIDSYKMGEIIRTTINKDGKLNIDELRINVRKYYQYNHNTLPTLVYKDIDEKTLSTGISKKDKLIQVFENTSPYNFLKSKNKGSEPTSRDLKIIEDLIINTGLNPGVVNVIVDYALKKNNNKLVKGYLEAIAGQLKRNNVTTALDALEMIKNEGKPKNKTTSIKKQQEPIWYKKEIKKETIDETENLEIEELLKEYR